MTAVDRDWWRDRAIVAECYRERALERAHVLLMVVERARRAGALWRAARWYTCWRRAIALANFHRDIARNARLMAGQHRTRRGAA